MLRRALPLVVVALLGGSLATARAGVGFGEWTVAAAVTTTATTSAPNLAAVRVRLVRVASGLDKPVAIAWRAGDSRMYVAEQSGHVRIVAFGRVVATALGIVVSTGAEQGLLGLTFSPDGTKMYVDYTDPNGDTRVDEYTMQNGRADVTTRRQLLFQDQPFPNHNGGQVTIGPDGMLYIAFGDGGGLGDPQNNGQKLSTLLGKILRIDPRPQGYSPYRIPPDNPFVGRTGVRPAIWMYGLRNPWRFSFDRATRDVWIGDVGQNLYEEVDYAPAGQSGINWGWSLREGFHEYKGARPPGARDPIIERSHTTGDCAIVGGYVYRGSAIPSLGGGYVYGDFCTGELLAAVQQGGSIVQSRDLGVNVAQLTTFGEGPAGELYAASRAGSVYVLARG